MLDWISNISLIEGLLIWIAFVTTVNLWLNHKDK